MILERDSARRAGQSVIMDLLYVSLLQLHLSNEAENRSPDQLSSNDAGYRVDQESYITGCCLH